MTILSHLATRITWRAQTFAMAGHFSVSPCSCGNVVAVCVGVAVKSATSSFTARPLLHVLVACVVVVLQLLGY